MPVAEFIGGKELPYVSVGDAIFPLKTWLVKPYPGRNISEKEAIFNYRLSRCRCTIENISGIYAAKWQIFRPPIRGAASTVDKIVKATVCLHNYLRLTVNAHYIPVGFTDSEDSSGRVIRGEWRATNWTDSALKPLARITGNRYAFNAKDVRQNFTDYVNSEEGSLSWQLQYVRDAGRVPV